MEYFEIFKKNNYKRNLIAKELKMDPNSLEFQNLVDKVLLLKIKELNKGKKIEIQIQGFDKDELLKASHLTNKRIENIYEFLLKILKAKSEEELVSLCRNSFYSFCSNNLYSFALGYCMLNKCLNMVKPVHENLLKKLQIYRKYKAKIRIEIIEKAQIVHQENAKQRRNVIENVIKSFIESNYKSIEEFVNNYNLQVDNTNNITIDIFNRYVDYLRKNNYELYKLYRDKINNLKEENNIIIYGIINKILDEIKNGILENGECRKFDLVDYYLETDLNPNFILKLLRKNNYSDYITFKKFLKKYQNMLVLTEIFIKSILEEKTIVNVLFDSNNQVIPGSGRLVTNEEKRGIIEYLKENNIPLYDATYSIILKRYLAGKIDLGLEDKFNKKKCLHFK